MLITIDTREKPHAIKHILADFDRMGILYEHKKLDAGDYMSADNPFVAIDRKEDITELWGNVTSDHDRFRRELLRANNDGIQLIVLVASDKITTLDEVVFWDKPMYGGMVTDPQAGTKLFNILSTQERKYGVKYMFCKRNDLASKILEILS